MVTETLDTHFSELSNVLEPLLRSHHVDPFIATTTKRLWIEMGTGDAASKLFAEGAILTIMGALQRLSKMDTYARLPSLTDSEVRLLVEAIDERLNTNLSLTSLAELVGWSNRSLGRAFKAKLGRSPYQYVLVT